MLIEEQWPKLKDIVFLYNMQSANKLPLNYYNTRVSLRDEKRPCIYRPCNCYMFANVIIHSRYHYSRHAVFRDGPRIYSYGEEAELI